MKNISYYKKILLVIAPLFLSVQAFAQDYNFNSDQVTLTEQLCPSVTALTQDPIKKTWSAPGGWRSINPSFFRELEHFAGAQWVGVNVGNIICSYVKKGRSDFAVHVQRNTIVPMPNGGLWSKDKGGYKDCFSSDVKQCAYFVMTQTAPKDIYEEINFFKDEPATDTP